MPGAYAVTFAQLPRVFTFRFQPENGVSSAALSCAFGYGPISALAEAGSFPPTATRHERRVSILLI